MYAGPSPTYRSILGKRPGSYFGRVNGERPLPGKHPGIDPIHARHSSAVTVVMYHMTYEPWRSSKKTASWIQAKCTAVRKMTWQLSGRLPQVPIATFTEDFRIAEWLRSLTSNKAVAMT